MNHTKNPCFRKPLLLMEAYCPSGMLGRQNRDSVLSITKPFLSLIRRSPTAGGLPGVGSLVPLSPVKMLTCGYLQKEQASGECRYRFRFIFPFARSASPEGECVTSLSHYELGWPQAFMIHTPGIANLGSAL